MRMLRELVEQGMRRPKGYGFAYRDFDTDTIVAYPIPFNVIIRGSRRFWHWVVGGYKNSVIDEARIKGIRDGQSIVSRAELEEYLFEICQPQVWSSLQTKEKK